MAVVKHVIDVVQVWLSEPGHHPQDSVERTMDEARLRALLMRQMYL